MKKEKSDLKYIINIVTMIVVISLLGNIFLALFNYNELKNGDVASNYKDVKKYTKDDYKVTEYDYYIFKIEEKIKGKEKEISIGLWFL